MDEFLLSVLEQIDMGSFVGSFGGTGDGVGGPYVCLLVEGLWMILIYVLWNGMTPHMFPVNHKYSHCWALDPLWEFGAFDILWVLEAIERL